MMKRLALALTALIAFAAPTLFGGARNIGAAYAQAPTGNPTISSVLSGGKRTLCVYIRGTNACDPISAFDTTSGAMTVLGVGIDMQAAAQAITTTPYAGDVPRTTSFALKGESKLSLLSNYLATFSIRCKTGAGQPIGVNEGCVAGYFDAEGAVGSSQVWGVNINVVQRPNFFANGGNSVIGLEVNGNDDDHDNGNFDGTIDGIYPSSTLVTLTSVGGHSISAAITVSGSLVNRGLAFSPGSLIQCAICDYGSGAATVIDIRGAHSAFGIDGRSYSGGPFLRLPSQSSIVARNAANDADMQLLATDELNQINIAYNAGQVVIYGGGDPGLTINSSGIRINSIAAAGVLVTDATGIVSSSATLPAARFPALNGDLSTPGGSLTTTLATVNANVGTFGSSTSTLTVTVDAKGRVTAISTNAVIAPAGTLSGTTLASNVVTSSLTAVGTLISGATGAGFTVNFTTSTFSGTLPTANTAALTGDVTKTAGSNATTLASVITAGGPTGSATVAAIITYDAKGRLTAVSSATITPALGSITGLGTGVATALAINVGSAGAFVTNGGALGTPSSGTGTNITSIPAANILSGALVNGMTATTQAANDNSTKLATTAYVDRVVPQGTWTAYTPTVSSTGGSITAYSVTSASYQLNGKELIFQATISITTDTTGAGAVRITTPVTLASANCTAFGREASIGNQLQGLASNTNSVDVVTYNNNYPGGSGKSISITGVCQAA